MMRADCAGTGHSIVRDERWASRSVDNRSISRNREMEPVFAMTSASFPDAFCVLLQLRVLRLGLLQDGDVGVGVFQECGKTTMELLLRQANLPHQLSKSRIGTQRIEQEIGVQTDQVEIALLISSD